MRCTCRQLLHRTCTPLRTHRGTCPAKERRSSAAALVPRAASRSAQMSTTEDILPVFDLQPFLHSTESPLCQDTLDTCKRLASCLASTGCLVVRDPRVQHGENEVFLDMMEQYFGRSSEEKMAEVRPELHYQVGATPAGTEMPRCVVDPTCQDAIQQQPEEHRATMPSGPDVKWRYMWRVGPRPQHTSYAELNAEPVVPAHMPTWQATMDSWGDKMLAAVEAAAQMAAVGFGLPRDAFSNLMANGPHLLAPTGADLAQNGQLGKVIAGYHCDLNFMTIHGKARFPGLYVWLRDGRRVPVRIPDGCLLIQAGKQLEWLTGGAVQAGMHEVVVTEATQEAAARARAAGRSLWRVSSTVFSHVASDQVLRPLGSFASGEACMQYPAVAAGEQVQEELEAINLKHSPANSDANNCTGM